jgi:hypothetical protein
MEDTMEAALKKEIDALKQDLQVTNRLLQHIQPHNGKQQETSTNSSNDGSSGDTMTEVSLAIALEKVKVMEIRIQGKDKQVTPNYAPK